MKTTKKKPVFLTVETDTKKGAILYWKALNLLTAQQLKGLLRESGIGIPKDKTEMAERLAGDGETTPRKLVVTVG